MNKKIQILLSTYNGEKYLKEQLDSYTNLSNFEEVKVLIRDDGSSDGTLKILKQYKEQFGFEVIEGKNLGVNASLLELFNHCDLNCMYFALSDQDDVWQSDKFQIALKALENKENKQKLFVSCSAITDKDLKEIGISLNPKKGISFYNAMIENICPGHTQVFNRAMLQELRMHNHPDIFVLDFWNYLVASAIGTVYFSPKCTVYHRQHGRNSVGYELNFWKSTYNRIKRLRFKDSDLTTLQLRAFYNLYKDRIADEYRKELENFFAGQNSLSSRLKYAFIGKAYRQTKYETWIFKLLYLLGKYHF